MKDEILEVAGKIYKSGMSLLVIDTENKFVSTGFAKEIARVAQGWFHFQIKGCSNLEQSHSCQNILHNIPFFAGKYYYLPNASDAVISAATKDALSALKSS